MKLNVMTFNVQHFRNYNLRPDNIIDIDLFANYIKKFNPDIIGLNEVNMNGRTPAYDKQLYVLADKAGYENKYFAEAIKLSGKYAYGNGMLSHYKFNAETIIIPDPDKSELNGEYAETRCVLKADYDFDGKKLTVLSCHFGLNIAEERNAVKVVCDIAKSCNNPLILMGDFNSTPDSEVLKPLFETFVDTEPLMDGENHFTFTSDNPYMKIDYMFLRGDIKALSSQINRDIVSDHFSIISTVEF